MVLRAATSSTTEQEFRRLNLERKQFVAHFCRRLGVTRTEFDALDELRQGEVLSPVQLGKRLSLTSGSVTALLDRLERLGWVTRERHPDDRRMLVIRLTEEGRAVGETELGTLDAAIGTTAARLSAKDQRVVERFLAAAADELAQLVGTEQAIGADVE